MGLLQPSSILKKWNELGGTQLLPILAFSFATSAVAETSSIYTTIDINTCHVVEAPPLNSDFGYGAYVCKGLGAKKIFVLEGDIRTAIAFGTQPQRDCAASQTFVVSHDLVTEPMSWRLKHGRNGVDLPKIEWRIKNGTPVATIVRWTVARGFEHLHSHRSVLVVTKLETDNSCRIAVVDESVPNANEKARQIADGSSSGPECIHAGVDVFAEPGVELDIFESTGACFSY